jgi:hypothetical protein
MTKPLTEKFKFINVGQMYFKNEGQAYGVSGGTPLGEISHLLIYSVVVGGGEMLFSVVQRLEVSNLEQVSFIYNTR